MSEPLAQALRISGASLIMLTSIESRTTVWSAGRARVGADVAALGAAITEAAAEMVRLTASGSTGEDWEMDDLLVTSPANFHLLRVVDGQVAHLVLDRGVANLAMARREFRQVVADRAAPALPAQAPEAPSYGPGPYDEAAHEEASYDASVEPGPPPEVAPAGEAGEAAPLAEGEVIEAEFVETTTAEPEVASPFQAIPVQAAPRVEAVQPVAVASPFQAIPVQVGPAVEAVVAQSDFGRVGAPRYGEALEGEVLPASNNDLAQTDRDLPRLPQRRADASWQDDAASYQASVPALPDWLRVAAEGPFVNDAQTLDRVVGGLRRLR